MIFEIKAREEIPYVPYNFTLGPNPRKVIQLKRIEKLKIKAKRKESLKQRKRNRK